MRKAILPIVGILLLGAGVAIGWFTARRGMPDAEQKAPPGGLGGRPALEQIDEAEQALRLAGFQEAFVYRWRGGLLDGYVLLDTPKGTERVSLNTEQQALDAHQVVVAQAKEQRGPPVQLDLARVRGLIVIAIRPKAKGAAGHECIMKLSATFDGEDTSSTASTGIISGRLPDWAKLVRVNELCKLTLADGGKRDLFELRLRRELPPSK
jgi:hypothetical protein